MPDTRDEERRDEVHDEREASRTNNLGPWILGSAAVLAISLLLCCFPRGCKRGCADCDKPVVEPNKDTVYVIKKNYHVGNFIQ